LPAYRPSSPYEHPPLRRRASGFALALGVNLLLLLVLLGIGKFVPVAEKPSRAIVVDLAPESQSNAAKPSQVRKPERREKQQPLPKPPRIVLPAKPTIARPPAEKPLPWIEMSKEEMAAGDIGKLPKAGSGSAGDSEEVGRGPNGEVLYAAEWARRPTAAELSGYMPRNAPDGWGLIACKTIPGNRVDDCIELGQDPPGSHLASAVRQAAWQFRVRPPRKNGRPLVGSWVQIRIDYTHVGG
jgi:protein TonB